MMDYGYAIYQTGGETPGRIVRNGSTDQSAHVMAQPTREGEDLYPSFLDLRTQYVDVATGEGMERPIYFESQYRLALDEALTVANIPAGTIVMFQGEQTIMDGSDFEFSSSLAGMFRFQVKPAWPAQEHEVGILVQ